MPPRLPRLLIGMCASSALISLLPELARMRAAAAGCAVVMTPSAARLMSPALTGSVMNCPVYVEVDEPTGGVPRHRSLAADSDIALVAPATLNTLSSLAVASTSNLLTLTLANFGGPVGLLPVLNDEMRSRPAVQRVLDQLAADGFAFPPEEPGAARDLSGRAQAGVSRHGLNKLVAQLATRAEAASRDD